MIRLLDIMRPRRAPVDWGRLADRQDLHPRPVDPELRETARVLHRQLSRFLQASDPRALRPVGLADADLPPGTSWHWRPALLRRQITPRAVAAPAGGHPLGEGAALWHDCPHRALILRQSARLHPGQEAGYGLGIEVLGFAGSFLSLALDLPAEAMGDLGADRILQLDLVTDAERLVTLYARINLVQGPNTETMLRQLGDPVVGQNAVRRAEFDLAYAGLANRPVERAWLDLILEAPHMNAVALGDAVISYRPRAQV